ncbi:MAG: DUF4837 family protein [Flavobacteriales bacterium]
MKFSLSFMFSFLFLISCNNGKQEAYKPKSVGNINSLQIVIDDDLWNGEVGEEIRTYFAAPTDGLPQDEPLFSMSQIKTTAFKGFLKSNRIFLYVSLGDQEKVSIQKNPYAKPQTGVFIQAPTPEGLVKAIEANHKKIIAAFHDSEIHERQRRTAISVLKIDSLKERLGVSLMVPSAYRVAKATKDFYWIRKDLKSGNTNIIIYQVPLNTITNDSLAMSQIIKMRDTISGAYMPVEAGRFVTEEAYAPFLFKSSIDQKFAYETKGTWEVKTQYMAGPFVNFAIKDTANNRYLILEGFTYAPSAEKRNHQFELESILRSAKVSY